MRFPRQLGDWWDYAAMAIDAQKALAAFANLNVDMHCKACETGERQIVVAGYAELVFGVSGRSSRCVVLLCDFCGHTSLYNAVTLGLDPDAD